MVTPVFQGEVITRQTLEPILIDDSARFFTFLSIESLKSWYQGQHYDGFQVSAVAPGFDGDGNLKLLKGSNYRPGPLGKRNPSDIRVCAEQALINNSLDPQDHMMDLLLVRGPAPDPSKKIEGNRESLSLHPCRHCRGNLLSLIGADLLVVTFVEDAVEPTEALTLGQMIGYHDLGQVYPEQTASARDLALQRLSEQRVKAAKKPKTISRRATRTKTPS